MKIVDGWEYKELKKRNPKIVTRNDNRRFEMFHLGNIDCFSWLADPNKIWAHYGTTRDFGELYNYLDDCIKHSEYEFKLPTPEDLRFYIENDAFQSYQSHITGNVWSSEDVDDGVNRHIFFLLKTEDL